MIRKTPLLPGLDTKNEIELIVECIGTPDISTMDIPETSKQQIRDLPKRSGKVFDTLFSKISPSAIDLLKKMLTFDPKRRISAAQAMEHPFFEDIHYEDEEEPHQESKLSKAVSPVEFEFEYTQLNAEQLKGTGWSTQTSSTRRSCCTTSRTSTPRTRPSCARAAALSTTS